ncbi:hypothetical protein [Clostridium akagii]|uniref:hypothetical protein n=1 Tax=Clostridium akagii TaxID=91623 RepID=UPI00047B142C|nr:hypothetical protein [Clostridium akagii]
MKISKECWHCGSTKLKYNGQSYCIFDSKAATVVIRDEPDNCVFLAKDDPIYAKITEEYNIAN